MALAGLLRPRKMSLKHRKALVLVGATLTISPIAILTYYGNILPYIDSYLQARREHIHLYLDPLWPTTAFRCCFPFAMIFTSPLERCFGIRPCILAGILLMDASVASCFFTVNEPVAFMVVFGALHGVAVGLIYPLTLKLLLQTMGEKGGTATGIVSIGPAIGALINIAIAFWVINPEDKKADLALNNKVYFSDPGVISRVPYYFLAAGAFFISVTFTGFACMYIGSLDSENEVMALATYSSIQDCVDIGPEQTTTNGLKMTDKATMNGECPEQNFCSNGAAIGENKSERNNATIVEKCQSPNGYSNKNGQLKPPHDLCPSELLRTRQFWCVSLCYFSFTHAVYVHLNLYKQYGQLAISSDAVLVTTGLVCTVGMMVTRPLIGVSCDKIGSKSTCLAICSGAGFFMSLMVVAIHTAPSLYPPLVVIAFECVSTQSFLFSILISELFGKTSYPSNFGLVSCGQPLLMIAEPFVVSALVQYLGWDWIFLSGSLAALLSAACILALDFVNQ